MSLWNTCTLQARGLQSLTQQLPQRRSKLCNHTSDPSKLLPCSLQTTPTMTIVQSVKRSCSPRKRGKRRPVQKPAG
ncbi:hypothetical protein BN1708_009840 [Verticillium longisporum]|uniref:Uncharacterized protein n=1 Tax=Verticillium longisporum TaxID=100787 RepID=A0A0G4KKY8_VERLO|nr:hypothetical protein BN1708_009840 [Verticillium longisporum]